MVLCLQLLRTRVPDQRYEIKLIAASLKKKVKDRKQGKQVRVAGLQEFEATSEASNAESLLAREVLGRSIRASTVKKTKKTLTSTSSGKNLLPMGLSGRRDQWGKLLGTLNLALRKKPPRPRKRNQRHMSLSPFSWSSGHPFWRRPKRKPHRLPIRVPSPFLT